MDGILTKLIGSDLPSDSAFFISVLSIHVLLGVACVVLGIVAMLSKKQSGNHPNFGTAYYWCLAILFSSATVLAAQRWSQDYHLFILGALAFLAATVGRRARRRLWPKWIDIHVIGMGLSYVLMLTAFYVDNGKNLPVWRDLPYAAYWVLPGAVGVPLMMMALFRWHRKFGERIAWQKSIASP